MTWRPVNIRQVSLRQWQSANERLPLAWNSLASAWPIPPGEHLRQKVSTYGASSRLLGPCSRMKGASASDKIYPVIRTLFLGVGVAILKARWKDVQSFNSFSRLQLVVVDKPDKK